MDIETEIKQVLLERRAQLEAGGTLRELETFYEDMKQRDLVIKREYSIPKLDTVGKRRYQQTTSKVPKPFGGC